MTTKKQIWTAMLPPTCKLMRLATAVSIFGLSIIHGGCASVISKNRYPVTIDNAGAPTYFSIQDRKNQTIHQGVTPQQVDLDAKAFPFWPAKYDVVFAGYDQHTQRREVKAGFDPWIAGNLLLGGGAGAIVDGATGAMFKLPSVVRGDVAAPYAITEAKVGYQVVQGKLMGDESMRTAAATKPAATIASR